MRLLFSALGLTATLMMHPASAAISLPKQSQILSINIVEVAQTRCTCLEGYEVGGHGVCTDWGECGDEPMSVPHTPVRSAADCPDSRILVCEDNKCTVSCELEPQGK